MRITKLFALGIAAAALIGGLAACGLGQNANDQETNNQGKQQSQYDDHQKIPFYTFSQIRETLIQIENAQANGVATTSFMMNFGPDPIDSCPSIGFPIPTTTELNNPQQTAGGNNDAVIGLQEPTGVYPGSSSGTYVLCALPNGTTQARYWEGYVETVGGPAHWDYTTHRVVLDGASTVNAKTHQ